jgi:hypothetical protein
MADTAAHLVDRVLPEVPIRQWVLTLPYPLRYRCAYDAKLASDVLRAFARALFAELRRRVRRHWRACDLHCGAVTFLQRFGSALNLNLHFHTLALDGAYTGIRGPEAPTRFLPLPPPDDDEVMPVLAGTARRLERLCCYVARPPLANERLEELPDKRLALRLKTRWRDGTSHILMERSELIERLVPAGKLAFQSLLEGANAEPPVRSRHFPSTGSRGANARPCEGQVTPGIDTSSAADEPRISAHAGADARAAPDIDPRPIAPNRGIPRPQRWAALLQRVFEIDALRCPRCGSRLCLIAAIEDPTVARKILECLKLPARAPPLEPASAVGTFP